jgi:lysine decarboxylase
LPDAAVRAAAQDRSRDLPTRRNGEPPMTTTSPRAVIGSAGPFRQGRRADGPRPSVGAASHPVRAAAPENCFGSVEVAPGEQVLVARDARPGTHTALVLTGAVPVWVTPRIDPQFNLGTGLHPDDVESALQAHPDVRVLQLASPSYAGVHSDLPALRAVTERHGVELAVDDGRSPRWRRSGADEDATRAVAAARQARSLLARIPGVHVLSAADLALPTGSVEVCTVVLEVRGRGLDGPTASRVLRDNHGIDTDGVDTTRICLDIGPDHDVASLRRLVLAVAAVGSWSGPARPRRPDPLSVRPDPGEQVLTPREAWLADTERVPLHRAVGRVCTELITPYPPGIPVVAPGEVVTAPVAAWLMESSACRVLVRGVEDPSLASVRVVADD